MKGKVSVSGFLRGPAARQVFAGSSELAADVLAHLLAQSQFSRVHP